MLKNVKLVKPTVDYKEQIINYRESFLKNKEIIHGSSSLDNFSDLNEWFKKLEMIENIDTVPACHVPSSTYLLVTDDNTLIGMVSIRHSLNENLKIIGGHIGYSIHPKYRMKGYGTIQLRLALEECKKFNITKVLITCDSNNIGSKKIIINNGGKYVDTNQYKDEIVERYWITI